MRVIHIRSAVAAALLATGLGLPTAALVRAEVIVIAPPAPRVEAVPAPRKGYVWAPGYWRWEGRHHVWVPGYYVRVQHGRHWVPEHWEERGGRWYFRKGHWERD